MPNPAYSLWRLSDGGETSLGLSCTEAGLFLGSTPLLEQRGNRWAVRAQQDLERLFTSGFGFGVALDNRMGGFDAVAKAMNERDLCRATIAAVMLRIPDLPGFPARLALEAEDRLMKLDAASQAMMTRSFNPDLHPHWPGGRPDGGQFRPTGGANDNSPLQEISDNPSPGIGHNQGPPLDEPPQVPPERPPATKVRNAFLRRAAKWLADATGRLAGRVRNPRVRAFIEALHAVAWLADEMPSLVSYFDAPEDLTDLQAVADDPKDGYEIHHIVEVQGSSQNVLGNSRVFSKEQLEGHENRVRIPYWKHREISDWYSTPNDDCGMQTPREFMRGKSWEEQYRFGLEALRRFKVLK